MKKVIIILSILTTSCYKQKEESKTVLTKNVGDTVIVTDWSTWHKGVIKAIYPDQGMNGVSYIYFLDSKENGWQSNFNIYPYSKKFDEVTKKLN